MDIVIITPEPGEHARIGKELLAVLDTMGIPHNTLQWVTWPKAGFAVPVEVFNAFETPAAEADPAEQTPKKRGRPRKTQPVESTDDPEKEE